MRLYRRCIHLLLRALALLQHSSISIIVCRPVGWLAARPQLSTIIRDLSPTLSCGENCRLLSARGQEIVAAAKASTSGSLMSGIVRWWQDDVSKRF